MGRVSRPRFRSWRLKTTTFGASHSPPLTPLSPAFTLSMGEHRVRGGEFKVSRTQGGALPHILLARRSKPKMAALIFWRPFQDSLSRRHDGATGVLFRAHGSRRCPPDRCLNWDCWLCLFRLRRTLSLRPLSTLLHHLRRTATVMARKKPLQTS